MSEKPIKSASRRRFLQTVGATALAATGPAIVIPGRAQPKTLKIRTDKSFIAGFDQWFFDYAQTWGKQNDTRVIIEFASQNTVLNLPNTEVAAQKGFDLVKLLSFFATNQIHLIDHREIYEECERHYGKVIDAVSRISYSPKVKKHFAFGQGFMPSVINYRKDLWDNINAFPDSWDDVWRGGRHINLLHDISIAIALSDTSDSNHTLSSILYSFGGSVQDERNRPVLKSRAVLEAIKFVKALYDDAMTADVLTWDNTSNNRVMLSGQGSLAWNPISITRSGENKGFPITDKIGLAQAPKGPKHRLGSGSTTIWGIWKFAENIKAARKFLVDYVGSSRQMLTASRFLHLPSFPLAVPDQAELLAHDAKANPPHKYKILKDAQRWHVGSGYPGYYNPSIDEVNHSWLIPRMFANAATGKMTPEEALTQADQEVRKIYDKW